MYAERLLLFLEFFAGGGLFLVLEFKDVGARVGSAEEPVGEEIATGHGDVADDGHVRVAHAWLDLNFEALVGADEGVGDAHGVDHADVFVHVAGGEHEVAF